MTDRPDITVTTLLKKLTEDAADIDNLLIIYNYSPTSKLGKEKSSHIAFGYTSHTNTSWFLAALEWVRWHVYHIISAYADASSTVGALRAAVRNAVEEGGDLMEFDPLDVPTDKKGLN